MNMKFINDLNPPEGEELKEELSKVKFGKNNIGNAMLKLLVTTLKHYGKTKAVEVLRRQLTVYSPIKNSFKVQMGIAQSGRIFAKNTTYSDSHQQAKESKYLNTLDMGEIMNLDWNSWVYILFQLATLIDDKASPLEKSLIIVDLLDENGFIDENKTMNLVKESQLKRVSETREKGHEVLIEATMLINGFNNPKGYGYEMLTFVDAKAQNWSIYAFLFIRNKKLSKQLNMHVEPTEPWYMIKPADFNGENRKAFIDFLLAKGYIKEGEEHRISRDVIKFIAMTMGYGSGYEKAKEKAISESAEKDQEFVRDLLDRISEKEINEFLDKAIPNFAKFKAMFNMLVKQVEKRVYKFDILDFPYTVAGEMYKKVEEVAVKSKYDYTNVFYLNKYEFHEKTATYQLYKQAYATHHLDAWLVNYTNAVMQNQFGVQTLTNHDSYGGHPQYMFRTMEVYLNGLKTLAKSYDGDVLKHIMTEYSNEDKKSLVDSLLNNFRSTDEKKPEEEYIEQLSNGILVSQYVELNDLTVEDVDNMDSLHMLNHIWA
jgi:hypothetical protein